MIVLKKETTAGIQALSPTLLQSRAAAPASLFSYFSERALAERDRRCKLALRQCSGLSREHEQVVIKRQYGHMPPPSQSMDLARHVLPGGYSPGANAALWRRTIHDTRRKRLGDQRADELRRDLIEPYPAVNLFAGAGRPGSGSCRSKFLLHFRRIVSGAAIFVHLLKPKYCRQADEPDLQASNFFRNDARPISPKPYRHLRPYDAYVQVAAARELCSMSTSAG